MVFHFNFWLVAVAYAVLQSPCWQQKVHKIRKYPLHPPLQSTIEEGRIVELIEASIAAEFEEIRVEIREIREILGEIREIRGEIKGIGEAVREILMLLQDKSSHQEIKRNFDSMSQVNVMMACVLEKQIETPLPNDKDISEIQVLILAEPTPKEGEARV